MSGKDYIFVLKAIYNIPFGVGKNLLIDFLKGEATEQIKRNKIFRLKEFGALELYEKPEIRQLINKLIKEGLIEYSNTNQTWKSLRLTAKGLELLENPIKDINIKLNNSTISKIDYKLDYKITDEEKKVFELLDPFLSKFNELQKKSIISQNAHILVIAGPGTGKTTVLTERTKYLINFKSIMPKDILLITFTRKAKQEMENRLNIRGLNIHTFNSFSEKQLIALSDIVYGRNYRVIDFKTKFNLVNSFISIKGINNVLELYFTKKKLKIYPSDKLFKIMVNEIFEILEVIKTERLPFETLLKFNSNKSKFVYELIKFISQDMKKKGLRDYSDQLIDYISFIKNNPYYIPKYKHILVDEFQDVNSLQIQLLELLNPENLFVVGDPRQAIYGWRGSRIEYILNFQNYYSNAEVIPLLTNYRSSKNIIKLFNKVIKPMGLPDIKGIKEDEGIVKIFEKDNLMEEINFIKRTITSDPNKKTFILARTNSIVDDIITNFDMPYCTFDSIKEDCRLVIGTVHSAKGLEAERVFIIATNSVNFPVKAKESLVESLRPIYNEYEEELRLLYVALSRAINELYITYHNKISPFIKDF